jgi:spore maturation protein CgeB
MLKSFRIDFLMPGVSQYGVLHHFTRKFYEALVRKRITCRLLETKDQDILFQDPPDITVGFNGAPSIGTKDHLICDRIRVPHLACLVDPPFHYYYLLKSSYTWICCDDRRGETLLNEMGFLRHFFLPHAVEPELSYDPDQERVFDVVLLSSFIDFERRRRHWKKKFPVVLCKALDHAIEMTFANQGISFIDAFNRVLEEVHKKYPPEHFKDVNFVHLLTELELYVKGRDKIELLSAIQDVPVHIFGNSIDKVTWKQYFAKKKTLFHIHDSLPFDKALDVMKQTKILLNPALKNCDGTHERVFSGIACGALVITNPSRYLAEHFQEDKDILYYRHTLPEKTHQLIHHYLNHPEEKHLLVEQGRKKVLEYETWDNRADTFLQQLSKMIEKRVRQ